MIVYAADVSTWFGGGVVGVVIAAIIGAIVNRRKLSADAAKIITDAAAGVVEVLKSENTRVLAEVAEVRQQVRDVRQENEALRTEARQTRDIVVTHAAWDQQVVEIAGAQGLTLPPVPPLYPKPGS